MNSRRRVNADVGRFPFSCGTGEYLTIILSWVITVEFVIVSELMRDFLARVIEIMFARIVRSSRTRRGEMLKRWMRFSDF